MNSKKLVIPPLISGGMLLSYKCNVGCRHCLYACSRHWNADWISEEKAKKVLDLIANKIQPSPFGSDRISINYGLHFTGGEPFLNFELLCRITKLSQEFGIPSTFVETNCFWCKDNKTAREKLHQLKEAGLRGMLISINPFLLERIPFERIKIAVKVSKEIFNINVIIYQEFFYQQFMEWKIVEEN